MLRKPTSTLVRKGEMITNSGMRKCSRRPKKTLIETINKDLNTLNLIRNFMAIQIVETLQLCCCTSEL